MKTVVCFFALAIFIKTQALTEEQKANWKKWSDECRTETGVSQEDINNLRNNNFENLDPKIKDHSLCFAKKAGLADTSGNIVIDQIKIKLKRVIDNDEEVEKIAKKCTEKKDTPAQTAFDTFKCLRDSTPKFIPV